MLPDDATVAEEHLLTFSTRCPDVRTLHFCVDRCATAPDACSTQASGDEPRRAAGLLEAAVRLRVHILRPRGRGLRPPEIT